MARALWLPVLALALGLWLAIGLEANRHLLASALRETEALAEAAARLSDPQAPVSYTHLTLPTICSV